MTTAAPDDDPHEQLISPKLKEVAEEEESMTMTSISETMMPPPPEYAIVNRDKAMMTTFDHRKCRNINDHRYMLWNQLIKEELNENDETEILKLVKKYPKTCHSRYTFTGGWKSKGQVFPLGRICFLKPSLGLVKAVHDAFPDAIYGLDGREHERLPIHYACRFGASREVINYLIQLYPASVRAKTAEGSLPIHYVCRNGDVDTFDDLHALYPESVTVPNKLSWLPLHFACCNEGGPSDMIRGLICLHPEASKMATDSGALPLHYAMGRIHDLKDIKALIAANPDGVRTGTLRKKLPLHHACQSQAHLDVVSLLVEKYPESVQALTYQGKTALQVATENNAPLDVVAFLEIVGSEFDLLLSLSDESRAEWISQKRQEAFDKTTMAVEEDGNEDDTSDERGVPTRTLPGAVRVRGVNARNTSDDMSLDEETFSTPRVDSELAVAAELSPDMAELEAELQEYRQRFENDVVHADEVVVSTTTGNEEVPVPATATTGCCNIL